MNDLGIKIVSVFVILLFCLSPLGAIDLSQENDTTHGNRDNGADLKTDANSTDSVDEQIKTVTDIGNDEKTLKSSYEHNTQLYLTVKDVNLGEKPTAVCYMEYIWTPATERYQDCSVNLTGPNNYHKEYVWRIYRPYENIEWPWPESYRRFTLPELAPGTYNLTVHFNGTESGSYKFLPATVSDSFTVKKIVPDSSDFDVRIDDVCRGQKPTLRITSPEGMINNLTIETLDHHKNYSFPIKAGSFEYLIDEDFDPGSRMYEVYYPGDRFYESRCYVDYFNVSDKFDSGLSISVDDLYKGDKYPVVHVRANESINGDVAVKLYRDSDFVDSKQVKLVNGEANVTIGKIAYYDKLPYGNYSTIVTFDGDGRFNRSEKTAYFSVIYKYNPNLNVSVDDVLKNEDPIVKIKANESINKDVTVKLKSNGSDITESDVTLVNGEGNWTVNEDLEPGNYSILVTFSGDDTFNRSEKSANFTVSDKDDPGLSVSVNDIYLGEKPIVKVKANETVNWYVDVKIKSNNTIINSNRLRLINGVTNWTIEEDLDPGTYSVVANFTGDNNFNASVKSANFNVGNKRNPHLSVSVDPLSVGGKPTVHVNANKLLNGTVDIKLKFKGSDFIIAGSRIKVVDGDGNLTIGTLMPRGNYSIVANFIDDGTFIDGENSTDFTVT